MVAEIDISQPKLVRKEIDIEEVYEAIKKNGYVHLRGQWVDVSGKAGCVLGQAAINLKVAAHTDIFSEYYQDYGTTWYDNPTFFLDEESVGYDLFSQLNKYHFTDTESKWWNDAHTRLGSLIVFWNDKAQFVGSSMPYKYTLETYEEVVEMAYDVLKGHFGQKITVLDYDYGI